MAKYVSTKTYTHLGPVAYRQWRADSHCNLIHGYALSFHFEFESDSLDSRNWVMDFGGLRPLKDLLEDWFDHTLLVADDDPDREHLLKLGELGLAKITQVEKTGCEEVFNNDNSIDGINSADYNSIKDAVYSKLRNQ